ncbi:hypothetical protein ACQP2F_15325 [Actinoplanes sp. CA-030573]|uniref:hypothetical protein n=1 Tax=Actinoplanes sp. CA-030573 TaxID=3239898 RepID=UPI003D91C4FD
MAKIETQRVPRMGLRLAALLTALDAQTEVVSSFIASDTPLNLAHSSGDRLTQREQIAE